MILSRVLRGASAAALLSFASVPSAAQAQSAPFDLTGPSLQVTVKRRDTTLPISRVPNLAAGDRISVSALLPEDQSAHYLLVAVFLRGATNPPPKEWFFSAETWKKKDKEKSLAITVPEGAHQLALFMVPETGGDIGTLTNAVRGRPGAFVRASQDLNQAMLDRTRLETYLAGIQRQDASRPDKLEEVSPILARSLAMKLNTDCLQKMTDLQAACLTQDREALVLNDVHSATMTEALTGAPADLALQVAATPQGGMGYYSPYIGVVRDLARVLGAFHSAQFQYIPALAVTRGDRMDLLLNAVPSFAEPMSVLVTALPPIAEPHVPPLQAGEGAQALCAGRPDLVLPVTGGPLVYSTNYAHSMALRVQTKDGRGISLPVSARAEKGGFVIDRDRLRLSDFGGTIDATLQGYWGFQPFDGPRFRLANADGATWKVAEGQPPLEAGREARLELQGAATPCVEAVTARLPSGETRKLAWEAAGADRLALVLPANALTAGTLTVQVKPFGVQVPVDVPVTVPVPPPPPVEAPMATPAAAPTTLP
jgi:hypothetical protein